MTKQSIDTQSLWMDMPLPTFPPLRHDLDVDVVVVGGGITGVTTAYLLRNEGIRVALIERGRLAEGDSGHTTAHLTYVTDHRLHEMEKRFGADGAKALWTAGAAAIDQIETIVGETGAECEFKRVPGYLHDAVLNNDPKDIEQEIERLLQDAMLARSFGFDAKFIDSTPFMHRPGVRFDRQAKFHPRKYLNALLPTLSGDGCHVFEQTVFEGTDDKPFAVRANGKRIRCDYLVVATHNPLIGRKSALAASLFQTKLSLYTTYVIGARLPLDAVPNALFWDTSDPYDYLRVENHMNGQHVIFGGEDVKTGQEDNIERIFSELETRLHYLLPEATVDRRWMGQVIETDDGLPFIGQNADRQFIATGFAGNGYTFGTFGAMMARDRLLNRRNACADLFRVDRKPFHGGLWRYVAENIDFPAYFIRDRLSKSEGTLDDLRPGEGKIISVNGDKVAAYKNDEGELSLCSPVCTHMKCLVGWNDADKTWDCPCHGSRFHADGRVYSGPAQEPLEPIHLALPTTNDPAASRTRPP